MIKVKIVDWGDDPILEESEYPVVAYDEDLKEVRFPSITIEVEKYTGHSYDGGRLDISGYPDTIWVSHQHSVYVEEV